MSHLRPCRYSVHIAITSVLAVLPASAITFRTSAALLALHATLNASLQQDSFKNASTWRSQPEGSAACVGIEQGYFRNPHVHM